MSLYVDIHTYIYIYIYMCMYMDVYIYIYIYMHKAIDRQFFPCSGHANTANLKHHMDAN